MRQGTVGEVIGGSMQGTDIGADPEPEHGAGDLFQIKGEVFRPHGRRLQIGDVLRAEYVRPGKKLAGAGVRGPTNVFPKVAFFCLTAACASLMLLLLWHEAVVCIGMPTPGCHRQA